MRIALLALALAATPAWAETNLCTVIDTLPATIETAGVYCLEQDLASTMVTGDEAAIAIDHVADVVLDCNGHRLSGTPLTANADVAATGSYTGIRIGSSSRVTVRRCDVRGFFRGIAAGPAGPGQADARDIVIADNKVAGSLVGILANVGGESSVRANAVFDTLHTALSVHAAPGRLAVTGNTFARIGNPSVRRSEPTFGNPIRIEGGGGGLLFFENRVAEAIAPAGAATPVLDLVDAGNGLGATIEGNFVLAPANAAERGSATQAIGGATGVACADNVFVGYGTTLPGACAEENTAL